MNIKFVYVTLIAALMLSACASGSYILTGEKRTPLMAASVKLYISPPQEYEVIAIVNASSDSGWTQQGRTAYAVKELKKQAAKLGANGILLTDRGEIISTSAGAYGNGAIYYISSTAQTVTGRAIYVSQE